jgi:molecular chaperone DnaK
LDYKLSRAKFEEMVGEYIISSIELVKKTLKDAKFETKDIDDIILVGGQTRMPKIQEEIKNLLGKEPRKDINPDEVVAAGAAVQAGILQGDMKDVLLLDIIPLSLGIETLGGVNTVLIAKNTTIPTSKAQVFSTAADSQPSVEIRVLQGERSMANDSKQLGRFILDGIPAAPRGIPQIEVIFEIDANGILQVSAKDKGTGKEQSIKIEGSCGVSDEEVEKMKKQAELHQEEDKKKKELIEVKNQAETLIYSCQRTLNDAKDKIPDEVKKEVNEKMEELKKIKESDNIEEIKKLSEELSQIIQKAGAELYKQKQEEQSKQEDKKGEEPKAEAKTEEGEVTEEKKDEEKNEEKDDQEKKD